MDPKRTTLNNSLSSLAKVSDNSWSEPRLFLMTDDAQVDAFAELLQSGKGLSVHDRLDGAIEELYDIEHPEEKDNDVKSEFDAFRQRFDNSYGTWVFFPWSGHVVRFPEKEDLRKLRTSRNRNLVTDKEQAQLYDATVAVFGLSVGSNVVDSLLLQGIGGTLIFADMDHLEPSNLNRIRAPFEDVGLDKIDYVAKKISETDPYIRQVHYRDGLSAENLKHIIDTYRPDVLVDEMDQLDMKIMLRRRAAEHKIAVVSAADDGNDTLVDIERYDVDAAQPIFGGIIPEEIINGIESGRLRDRRALGMIIGRYFIGPDHIPLRMFQSLDAVGKTLPSWPQLGGAAVLAGVVAAFCAKQIILGLPLRDGRHVIGPEHVLAPEVTGDQAVELQRYKDQLTQIN